MKKLKECPICLSKKITFLFNQQDKNINILGKFSLFKCNNCDGIFLNPQPSSKESEKFYPEENYYSLGKIQDEKCSIKTRIKMKLYNLYFSKNKNLFKRAIFSPIKFMIRGTNIRKDGKLLDVGCGSGQFLYEMKSLGLDICGIEPGNFNEEGNKKYDLNIKKMDIKSARYPKDSFDIITLNHVLEHLNNPNETLYEINRVLKKEGTFILGIPNTNSLAYKIFGKNWYQLDIPRHVINYSNKNIHILLGKNGFKIQKIRYNSRPSQFSVSLMYTFNIKNRFIKNILNVIFLPLTWIVNSLRAGDQIEVWCEKK